jgi:hypothetical protein
MFHVYIFYILIIYLKSTPTIILAKPNWILFIFPKGKKYTTNPFGKNEQLTLQNPLKFCRDNLNLPAKLKFHRTMSVYEFLDKLRRTPEEIAFGDTMDVIDTYYNFLPTKFTNGEVVNEAGENSGSCKVFSFAQHHKLSKEETLACFGSYYRKDVLENPKGTDHQNIRNFMNRGWEGISFDNEALRIK